MKAKMKIRVKIELMLLCCADASVNVESQLFCVGTRIKLGFSLFSFVSMCPREFGIVFAVEKQETATVRLGSQNPLHILWKHSLICSVIYRTN